MLHRRFVAIEQLAVEVARIPIDQHPAEIKDHHVAMTHAAHFIQKSGRAQFGARCPQGYCISRGLGGSPRAVPSATTFQQR
jgi:hypothetical protein